MNQFIDSLDCQAGEAKRNEAPDLSYWSGFCESYQPEYWPLNPLAQQCEEQG